MTIDKLIRVAWESIQRKKEKRRHSETCGDNIRRVTSDRNLIEANPGRNGWRRNW